MKLDFTPLTDDQLIELLRAAAAEAVQRGEAVAAAARTAGLTEAEKARLEQQAYEAETASLRARAADEATRRGRSRAQQEAAAAETNAAQRRQVEAWKQKAALAHQFVDLIGSGWQVNVWQRSPGSEVRVYVQRVDGGRSGPEFCYYVTGNAYNPPGTMEYSNLRALFKELDTVAQDTLAQAVAPACKEAAKWPGLKMDCDQAIRYGERIHEQEEK